MRPALRIWTVALAALVALAAPASADPTGCPECDGDAPSSNDCGFSNADGGATSENASALADSESCVGNSDTHEKKGFWAVFSVCLDAFLSGVAGALGLHADADAYASQDGADVDANVTAPGQAPVDFDESPLGDLDGATWDAMGQANGQLRDAGVEPHGLAPVGGEDLPATVDEDECVPLDDAAPS